MDAREVESFLTLTRDLMSTEKPKLSATEIEKLFVDPQGQPVRNNGGAINSNSIVGLLSDLNSHVSLVGRRGTGKSHALALAELLIKEQRGLPVWINCQALGPSLDKRSDLGARRTVLYASFLESTLQALRTFDERMGVAYARSLIAKAFGGAKANVDEFEAGLPEMISALQILIAPNGTAATTWKANQAFWTRNLFAEREDGTGTDGAIEIKINAESLQRACRKLTQKLGEFDVKKIVLLVDDASELDEAQRGEMVSFIQDLIASAPNLFCVKFSLYPGQMYGIPNFDGNGLSPATTDPLYFRSSLRDNSIANEDSFVLQQYFRAILEVRLKTHELTWPRVLNIDDPSKIDQFIRHLFWSSSGLPRIAGHLLNSACRASTTDIATGRLFVSQSSLDLARSRYFDGNIAAHVPRYMTFVSGHHDRQKAGRMMGDLMTNLIGTLQSRESATHLLSSSVIVSSDIENIMGPLLSIGAMMKRAQFEIDGVNYSIISVNFRRCLIAGLQWDADAKIDPEAGQLREALREDKLVIQTLLIPLRTWLTELGHQELIQL